MALAGVIGTGAVALIVFDAGFRNSVTIARFGEVKESFVLHAERLWEPALRMAADYPLTGVGLGAYIIEVSNYSAYFDKDRTTPESSENDLLQVASELGAAGLIVAAWAALVLLREIGRARS